MFWVGAEERVLDPSPSQCSASMLEASAGQSGGPQEEVLESCPSFSPLLGLFCPTRLCRGFPWLLLALVMVLWPL